MEADAGPLLSHFARIFEGRREQLSYQLVDSRGNLCDELSYERLAKRVYDLATGLVEYGVQGERVLLVFPDGIDFIVSLLAVMFAGGVAVPMPFPKHRVALERLGLCIRDCAASLTLTATRDHDWVQSSLTALCNSPCFTEACLTRSGSPGRPDIAVASTDLALLQYTSGSTGAPKGVMVSHANLHANETAMQAAMGATDALCMAGWLPLTHDMGLMANALLPLFVGGRAVLCPPEAFIRRPRTWLDMFARYGANVGGGPCFAYELATSRIDEASLQGLDLSSWRVAFCGAEPVRATSLQAFERKFASVGFSASAWYPCYGLAESTLFVSGIQPWAGLEVDVIDPDALLDGRVTQPSDAQRSRAIVRCGSAAAEHEIRIVDPDTGLEREAEQLGEIWVAGPSVARGYWDQSDSSRATFHATLRGSDRRFLRTGDIGYLTSGQLCITGRLKDVLIVNGKNRHAEDLEKTVSESDQRLAAYPSAAFAAMSSVRELSVVLQETPRAMDSTHIADLGRSVSASLLRDHGFVPDVVAFVPAGTLPRTTSGKIRRKECRRLFEGKQLSIVWSNHLTV